MRDALLMVGALLGGSGVALGAFGAHALKARLGAAADTWDTAVLYQLVHALAIVLAVLLARQADLPLARSAGWLFAAGTLLFSGSLYVLALGGPRLFGPVTPIGGLAFLAGWSALGLAAWRGAAA